jgi:hypothetical protein
MNDTVRRVDQSIESSLFTVCNGKLSDLAAVSIKENSL